MELVPLGLEVMLEHGAFLLKPEGNQGQSHRSASRIHNHLTSYQQVSYRRFSVVDLSTLRSGGLAPGIGKSGHSGAKFLAQQVAAAPLAKKDPRSVNGWGYSQMLINEGSLT